MTEQHVPQHRAAAPAAVLEAPDPAAGLEALGYRVTAGKALAGGLGAGLAGLGTACADGQVTWPEVIVAAGLALTAAAGTWRVAYAVPADRG